MAVQLFGWARLSTAIAAEAVNSFSLVLSKTNAILIECDRRRMRSINAPGCA
jgi:hypothetical protein